MLTLTDARYASLDGHPLLKVVVDGVEAVLDTEWKPTLRDRGILALGAPFDGLWPPLVLDVDGRRVEIPGATDEPRLVALFDRFWSAANSDRFIPGPVLIPG